ncbi:MAG: hypothetical protein N4A38_04245 [Candidatus Gracilibacteria bacterium]|nr:hypothetical protein [Candidatus Gracilibacteria bacterium]
MAGDKPTKSPSLAELGAEGANEQSSESGAAKIMIERIATEVSNLIVDQNEKGKKEIGEIKETLETKINSEEDINNILLILLKVKEFLDDKDKTNTKIADEIEQELFIGKKYFRSMNIIGNSPNRRVCVEIYNETFYIEEDGISGGTINITMK